MDKKQKTNPIIGKEMTYEMKEYIDVFKYKFKLLFGIMPYVSVTSRGLYVGEISMRELLDITNDLLFDTCGHHVEAGIMSKTRLKPIVIHRQAFCKVASNLGYGCTSVAKFLDKNHATVVYSVRNVDNLLAVGDMDMQTCMDELYTRIETYILRK